MTREKELSPEELGPPWTVIKLLRWTTGYFNNENISDTPRLDADLLLGHVLGMERVELYARVDQEVDAESRKAFRQLVKRRAAGEPVAYLVGHRSFWEMELKTDDRALVPRPETEVLVEVALELLPEPDGTRRVVDIGTGSGAIALAMAHERDDLQIAATDTETDALEVAHANIEHHDQAGHIDLFHGDLFEPIPESWRPFDLIVSNPPYVPEPDRDDIMIDVRDHEPDEALFAGPDGLAVIKRLIPEAHEWLGPEGWLVIEMGHHQADDVRSLFEEAGYNNVEVRQDYGGYDRVTIGQK